MKILVAMKHVIDSVTFASCASALATSNDTSQCERVVNPFDECALEAGLRVADGVRRQARAECSVTALTVGPENSESVLRQALAMGASSAIRIDAVDTELDAHLVACAVARAARELNSDLVILGKTSTDDASAEVAQRLGIMLSFPQVPQVASIDLNGAGQLTAEVRIRGAIARVRLPLPAVLAVDRQITAPRGVCYEGESAPGADGIRYAALPAIIAARRQVIRVYALNEYLPNERPLTRIACRTCPPPRSGCQLLDASASLAACLTRWVSAPPNTEAQG
jgi:electron transfer flavoprotein beta subunit